MRTGAKTKNKILAILLVIVLAMGALMLTACKPKDDEEEPVPWEHLFGTYQFGRFGVKKQGEWSSVRWYSGEEELAAEFPRGSAEFECAMEGFNQLGQNIVIDKNGITFSGINFSKTLLINETQGSSFSFDKKNEPDFLMGGYSKYFFSREVNRYSMTFDRLSSLVNKEGETVSFYYSYGQK